MPIVDFDNDTISIINRDDGKTAIEFRDQDSGTLTGIARLEPATAVAMGQILVNKGQVILSMLEEAAAAAQANADKATIWRDSLGKVWYGDKGANLHPEGADTDMADHSWEEVETAWGPLTPVFDDTPN